MSESNIDPVEPGGEMAGGLPLFPATPGDDLASSLPIPDFRRKRLLFGRIHLPGQIHVYSANCRAGDRLRAQLLVPVLPGGGAAMPAFALVAQSLPYSADVARLPIDLPAGFSAVVAPPPEELVAPSRDLTLGVRYYAGPSIDTRTLVSGRCYLVVWNPLNQMGKYIIQIGHRRAWNSGYWLRFPQTWWQVRGWYDQPRTAAYVAGAVALAGSLVAWRALSKSS